MYSEIALIGVILIAIVAVKPLFEALTVLGGVIFCGLAIAFVLLMEFVSWIGGKLKRKKKVAASVEQQAATPVAKPVVNDEAADHFVQVANHIRSLSKYADEKGYEIEVDYSNGATLKITPGQRFYTPGKTSFTMGSLFKDLATVPTSKSSAFTDQACPKTEDAHSRTSSGADMTSSGGPAAAGRDLDLADDTESNRTFIEGHDHQEVRIGQHVFSINVPERTMCITGFYKSWIRCAWVDVDLIGISNDPNKTALFDPKELRKVGTLSTF